MLESILGKKIEETHAAEVLLYTDGAYETFSFETKKGREIETINSLLESFANYEDVIKVTFFEKEIKLYKNKKYEFKRQYASYFIGMNLSLITYSELKGSERDFYKNLMELDEYQTGAVIHPKTGIVSPLFTNDKVINFKRKEKTM